MSFDPETESNSLKPALEYFQYQLKGVSFLPKASNSYAQMPYEKISHEEYKQKAMLIKPVELSKRLKEASLSMDDPVAENY